MSTTELFAIVGLMASAFVAGLRGPAEDGQPPLPKGVPPAAVPLAQPEVDPKMAHFLECSKACDDCARFCNLCAAHCSKIVADGKKEHLETVRTCHDCATICAATSRIVAVHGPHSDLIVTACSEACKRCGEACEKYPADPIMKRCAEECRKCEKVCRQMLRHLKPEK